MFTLLKQDGQARIGLLHLATGAVETPLFMPTATRGALRGVLVRDIEESGTQMLLANAFHLMLRPGVENLKAYGGIHKFMGWKRPVLTDSGGYQIFSLKALRKVVPEGVHFRSPINGDPIFLSPERSIRIQEDIGADVIMCLDECTSYPASLKEAKKSMQLSVDWAQQCKKARQRNNQLLFGIVQGGIYPQLRKDCLAQLVELSFDGYALGGLSVGEPKESMYEVISYMAPLMPAYSVRYLMGTGTPPDLVEAIRRGIDMFDCVLPTRNARNGQLFTRFGVINIRNSRYNNLQRPPDENCRCYCCRNFSLGYLHHLFRVKEMGAAQLASLHNVFYYQELMKDIRMAIKADRLDKYIRQFYENYKIDES